MNAPQQDLVAYFLPGEAADTDCNAAVNQVCRIRSEADDGDVMIELGDGTEARMPKDKLIVLNRQERRSRLERLRGESVEGDVHGFPVVNEQRQGNPLKALAGAYDLPWPEGQDELIDQIVDYEFDRFQAAGHPD